jgi:hypothetical protein
MKEICKSVQDILNIPITFEEVDDILPYTYTIMCEDKKVKVTLDTTFPDADTELIARIVDEFRK